MYLLLTLISSIFGGGFMILPAITLIGAIIFHIEARHAQHIAAVKGLTQQINSGTKDVKVVDVAGSLGYFESGYGIFAVVCALATIVLLAIQYFSI